MKIVLYNLHNLCENNTWFMSRARRYFELNHHLVAAAGDDDDAADLIFIGGCVVTDSMGNRCREIVQNIAAEQRAARVVVFGCLAAFPEMFHFPTDAGQRVTLIPFRESRRLDALIEAEIPFDGVSVNRLWGHVPYQPCMGPGDVYVLIAQGCVNDCSYCTIRKAKGAVKSRPDAVIAAEVRELAERGVRTVTLLADDCGSFGADSGSSLPVLLDRLCGTAPDMRYKIYTMFPAIFLRQAQELKPFFAAGRISYLCLPVQSAAPKILERMGRFYDPGRLGEALLRLRQLDPEVFLYSHFIYNFPTESWADFEKSFAFARYFDHCVFIGYGENRGTRAAALVPKCDAQALEAKTRHLEKAVAGGRLAAFVVPRT